MNIWYDRPVLVTGATGLLGGWLCRRLLEHKADLVCLVRDYIPHCHLNQLRVRVVHGDVRNRDVLERTLTEYEIDTVFHLAAQTIVGTANSNPISTFESNIMGTWNMLEACRRSPRVKAIVAASSDKAYGEQKALPYYEDSPLQGQHPYDVSKSCADLIAQTYFKTYGLPVAVTRCANFYGGWDFNWNRIVPGTIRSVLKGERPIIRSDGKCVRDYLYIEDAVTAYMMLAENLTPGLALNFSSDRPITTLELVEFILKEMDSGLTPVILNEARNEILKQHLDSSRAWKVLGWAPAFTLEEGLRRTINWYKERGSNE